MADGRWAKEMTAVKSVAINEPFYQWAVKGFTALRRRIGMTINVHDQHGAMQDGQIFLFNHFARFETIIPQYFIYQATGAYCRCIATHELFEGSERFAKVLWGVGAVPNNHPGLLPFMAAEILRGRKVIFFPEGGMMKDRSMAAPRPKGPLGLQRTLAGHKQGASALAVVLEIFKKRILSVEESGDRERLGRWVKALGLASTEELLAAARKPTMIVPSNITFSPIHVGDNILRKAAEFLHIDLGQRGTEELLVEGNLILRETDMDIRFGKPLHPDMAWGAAERLGLARAFEQIENLDDLFGLKDSANRWVERLTAVTIQRATRRLRDLCMVEMYAGVTVNINHLASGLFHRLWEQGETVIDKVRFGTLLYGIVKQVQREPDLHLHRSLLDPERYEGLHAASSGVLDQMLKTAVDAGLMKVTDKDYHLLSALNDLTDLRDPRLTNPLRVYANEIASLTNVGAIIDGAAALEDGALAEALFDDEVRAHEVCSERHGALAEARNGVPYFVRGEAKAKPGIMLVHGLLASPAELRAFGEQLASLGHTVLGVRLKGHGTVPGDLHMRTMKDWMTSVTRGHEIISRTADKVIVIGFGTGASLALQLAAQKPSRLAAVISIAAPLKFRMAGLQYAPLLDRLGRVSQWMRLGPGIRHIRVPSVEHPEIDYHDMPAGTVSELKKAAELLEACLPVIECPVSVIQATDDPVVDPASARMIYEALNSSDKHLHMIESSRHGILHDGIGETEALVMARIAEFTDLVPTPQLPVRQRMAPRISAAVIALVQPLMRFRPQRNA
jgi:esterase/lipase